MWKFSSRWFSLTFLWHWEFSIIQNVVITKTHHFYILNPNPWALMNSLSAYNVLLRLFLFLKFNCVSSISFRLLFCTTCIFIWWIGYAEEFSLVGMDSYNLQTGIKTSIILFISSEVFFFFSFFWSYFHFFLSPEIRQGFRWPPQGVIPFEAANVPLLNTLILLSSGLTVTVRHDFLNKGHNLGFRIFLIVTCVLGLTFRFFQWEEYHSSFFTIGDGRFGSVFFILTGFHGIHVLIGSIFLTSSLILSMKIISCNKVNFVGFEIACWYWHFVDVVWIFLFFLLYYLND